VLFNAKFDVFTAMKMQVAVFWVVTPCSVVVGYRRFRRPYCLSITARRHKPEYDDLHALHSSTCFISGTGTGGVHNALIGQGKVVVVLN
jgi:hypothetical protein